MFIVDANSTTPQVKTCGPIIPGASCSVEATLTSPAAGGPASPFVCFIDNPTGALRGSICGTVRRSSNRVAGEPVLPPGQLSNGMSGGSGPPCVKRSLSSRPRADASAPGAAHGSARGCSDTGRGSAHGRAAWLQNRFSVLATRPQCYCAGGPSACEPATSRGRQPVATSARGRAVRQPL